METSSEVENFDRKPDSEEGGNPYFSSVGIFGNFIVFKSCLVYAYKFVIDLNSEVQGLLRRIEKLEDEKQQIREEFGHQRAKMKELYLQKEGNFILKSVCDYLNYLTSFPNLTGTYTMVSGSNDLLLE
jgi:hypothetical protein